VEVFDPASARVIKNLQDDSSVRTTQKTQPLYSCRGVFTAQLHSGADHIENAILLLLRACMLRALPSKGLFYRVTLQQRVYKPHYSNLKKSGQLYSMHTITEEKEGETALELTCLLKQEKYINILFLPNSKHSASE
jgi:hypothetical protein